VRIRACHRVLRVARTIADLDGEVRIAAEHVAEAIVYRRLDRRPESTDERRPDPLAC
jgi:magnesium chelatase family protein